MIDTTSLGLALLFIDALQYICAVIVAFGLMALFCWSYDPRFEVAICSRVAAAWAWLKESGNAPHSSWELAEIERLDAMKAAVDASISGLADRVGAFERNLMEVRATAIEAGSQARANVRRIEALGRGLKFHDQCFTLIWPPAGGPSITAAEQAAEQECARAYIRALSVDPL